MGKNGLSLLIGGIIALIFIPNLVVYLSSKDIDVEKDEIIQANTTQVDTSHLEEIKPDRYIWLYEIQEYYPVVRPLIKKAIEDDKIIKAEYDLILNVWRGIIEERERKSVDKVKQSLKEIVNKEN